MARVIKKIDLLKRILLEIVEFTFAPVM